MQHFGVSKRVQSSRRVYTRHEEKQIGTRPSVEMRLVASKTQHFRVFKRTHSLKRVPLRSVNKDVECTETRSQCNSIWRLVAPVKIGPL
jgi:hypothetical protein